jgi:hypothetical protein
MVIQSLGARPSGAVHDNLISLEGDTVATPAVTVNVPADDATATGALFANTALFVVM